jgi:hypothetical protein
METRFSKGLKYLNELINKTQTGSECYRLLVRAKYRYINDY